MDSGPKWVNSHSFLLSLMSPSKSLVFRMSPSSPLYEGPRQPSLSTSQPEVSELELFFHYLLTISNLSQTNALVVYESSDDAETPVPCAFEDTAEGLDEFEPDTSVALPPIPSMHSPVSLFPQPFPTECYTPCRSGPYIQRPMRIRSTTDGPRSVTFGITRNSAPQSELGLW